MPLNLFLKSYIVNKKLAKKIPYHLIANEATVKKFMISKIIFIKTGFGLQFKVNLGSVTYRRDLWGSDPLNRKFLKVDRIKH